jgi:hypothetical protein
MTYCFLEIAQSKAIKVEDGAAVTTYLLNPPCLHLPFPKMKSTLISIDGQYIARYIL